ncbi:hypothetical protein HDU76_000333 [Blyttiomyces sp. JEL0837]|nr:hypothetical protein HDU76_000333 [Blyttiomyces sp. JEL0837]
MSTLTPDPTTLSMSATPTQPQQPPTTTTTSTTSTAATTSKPTQQKSAKSSINRLLEIINANELKSGFLPLPGASKLNGTSSSGNTTPPKPLAPKSDSTIQSSCLRIHVPLNIKDTRFNIFNFPELKKKEEAVDSGSGDAGYATSSSNDDAGSGSNGGGGNDDVVMQDATTIGHGSGSGVTGGEDEDAGGESESEDEDKPVARKRAKKFDPEDEYDMDDDFIDDTDMYYEQELTEYNPSSRWEYGYFVWKGPIENFFEEPKYTGLFDAPKPPPPPKRKRESTGAANKTAANKAKASNVTPAEKPSSGKNNGNGNGSPSDKSGNGSKPNGTGAGDSNNTSTLAGVGGSGAAAESGTPSKKKRSPAKDGGAKDGVVNGNGDLDEAKKRKRDESVSGKKSPTFEEVFGSSPVKSKQKGDKEKDKEKKGKEKEKESNVESPAKIAKLTHARSSSPFDHSRELTPLKPKKKKKVVEGDVVEAGKEKEKSKDIDSKKKDKEKEKEKEKGKDKEKDKEKKKSKDKDKERKDKKDKEKGKDKKKEKLVLHPDVNARIFELIVERNKETFEERSHFPDSLREPLVKVATAAALHDQLDEPFVKHMKTILPYNTYTIKRLIGRLLTNHLWTEQRKQIEPRYTHLQESIKRACHIQGIDKPVEATPVKASTVNESPAPDGPGTPAATDYVASEKKKFRWNEELRVDLWNVVLLEGELAQLVNTMRILDNQQERMAEQAVRKAVYAKLVTFWLPGWMTTIEISNQFSVFKRKMINTLVKMITDGAIDRRAVIIDEETGQPTPGILEGVNATGANDTREIVKVLKALRVFFPDPQALLKKEKMKEKEKGKEGKEGEKVEKSRGKGKDKEKEKEKEGSVASSSTSFVAPEGPVKSE